MTLSVFRLSHVNVMRAGQTADDHACVTSTFTFTLVFFSLDYPRAERERLLEILG